jgi:hypothetical protein
MARTITDGAFRPGDMGTCRVYGFHPNRMMRSRVGWRWVGVGGKAPLPDGREWQPGW